MVVGRVFSSLFYELRHCRFADLVFLRNETNVHDNWRSVEGVISHLHISTNFRRDYLLESELFL